MGRRRFGAEGGGFSRKGRLAAFSGGPPREETRWYFPRHVLDVVVFPPSNQEHSNIVMLVMVGPQFHLGDQHSYVDLPRMALSSLAGKIDPSEAGKVNAVRSSFLSFLPSFLPACLPAFPPSCLPAFSSFPCLKQIEVMSHDG